ncbi:MULTISPECIES: sodium:solute symporter family protein [Dethiosulfovibrio]|uniref:Sodium:solute symporter family protein n=2 Tax=Dethiosulfovibrio TaxID=47054 RepID=A0ABS9EMY9_9BACT|nr:MULTISPECIES: sodium:solute symporter family protein [Dethiosulfovibrio]MCF4114261.1 sodium:solute symporter family protein [Dethiosulfovibrio russensis]MCF4142549.1 sodium:solute symporter family protein [Dethiosulfovibrio marinus]MCF4145586.1 sodium:solute symporter family protein [Dethiosulfovibrio acidaminovorans]
MTLQSLLYRLVAFGGYGMALILLAGRAFQWNETRRSFYLGGRGIALWPSVGTFGATWMSAASLLGYTVLLYQEGYAAFTGSVIGWMLGLPLLPLAVIRLRKSRALSLPQWLEERYSDDRLRSLSALCLLVVYTVYLIIQFRAFGAIVGSMLDIEGFMASILVYLFVLYTTFGGLPSVVRSDGLNLMVIVVSVTVAAWSITSQTGGFPSIHERLLDLRPELLQPWPKEGILASMTMALGWGLGVAANPQYCIRIISCKDRWTAWLTLAITSLTVSWIYICLTALGLGAKALHPFVTGGSQEVLFSRLMEAGLSPLPLALLMVGVLAAAVSTANSQLLLAACSFCYDLQGEKRMPSKDPLEEDGFLFKNRIAVAIIATVTLFLSYMPLPGILQLGRYSWSMVALCFLLPLYLPRTKGRRGLFGAMSAALIVYNLLVWFSGMSPETAMLPSLLIEGILWWILGVRR